MSGDQVPVSETVVTYAQTRKINLGNYESTDVSLAVTFKTGVPNSEEELYARAADFVEAKLDEEEKAIQEASKNIVTKNKAKAEKPEVEEKAPAKKKKAPAKKKALEEAPAEEEKEELTLETVKDAVRAYSKKYNKDGAKAMIKSVTGSEKMASIAEDHLSEMMIALEKEPPVDEDEEDDLD
jgi:archaellum component FlaD/FlaE